MINEQTGSTNLVVNKRYASRQLTGVERYASEIFKRLGDDIRVAGPPRSVPRSFGHVWEQMYLPLLIKPDEILWSPANTGPVLLSNQVLTIHDLVWMDSPGGYKSIFIQWYQYLLPKLIRRVRHLITVSRYIKIRMMARFQISENRVDVVPGGVDRRMFAPVYNAREVLRRYALPDRFILYVGTQAKHKNLQSLCRAWHLLQQRYPSDIRDLFLVIAGTGGIPFKKLTLPLSPGIISLGYIPDKYLPALYSAALAFINPSVYEGFGMTTLEAMACGTAVLLSMRGALPEVAGNAAIYFDPGELEDIAACIHRVVLEPELREDLQKRGISHAAQFSWDTSAGQVRRILQESVG